MSEHEDQFDDFEPLPIRCTSSDCASGLHCFMQTRKMRAAGQKGPCRSCGAELVDWKRVYRRDKSDAAYTFLALKHELIRHHFWHIDIDQKAINHARRKGHAGMRLAAEQRLRKYVAPAHNPYDGRQTPMKGNAIFYAQHATATCCRKCIEEWHDIPRDQALTDDEITYLVSLITLFIEDRLPFLTENGEKVPPARKDSSVM